MTKRPILSICIPTYNRADMLKRTLDSIVSSPRFQNTDDVEIVISDNCSPDNTPDTVKPYIKQYKNKIRYFRNTENVYDKNLELSMSRGRGHFLKSHNDTLMLRPDALDKMCDFLQKYVKSKPIVFFLNQSEIPSISEFNNPDEFISHITIYSTWIGGFGLWKSDFDKFDDFSRFAPQRLPQTDIMFRLMPQKQKFAVMNDILFAGQSVQNKGGYNIAQVFGHNYMILLKQARHDKIISCRTFSIEKRRMLKHVNYFYFDIYNQYAFDKTGYWKYMHDLFWNPYFYLYLVKTFIRKLKYKLRGHR